jgi:hypothetical protein
VPIHYELDDLATISDRSALYIVIEFFILSVSHKPMVRDYSTRVVLTHKRDAFQVHDTSKANQILSDRNNDY